MKEDEGYRPGTVARGDTKALRGLESVLVRTLEPAPRDHIECLLAELHLLTRSKAHDEMEIALLVRGYVSRLEKYPADIAQKVLEEWGGKWFPAWGELKEQLDRLVAPRHRMLIAVREGMRRPKAVQIDEPRISDAERAGLKEKLDYFLRRARVGAGPVPEAR